MRDIVSKIRISPEASIKEALKKIDEAGLAILFVCGRDGSLLGSLTDGDIRRKVLKGGNLQEKITNCFNRKPAFVVENNYTTEDVKALMLDRTIEVIPVVDNMNRIADILFWKDLFEKDSVSGRKINVPLVIMAGGKGERLGPFTKILPKPLIPIGEKPIIEIIIDKFRQHGVKQFYITLNYKGEMIKAYFESIKKECYIEYVWEKEFLGTAGSLKLMPLHLEDTFIVSNCDIIVNANYEDLLNFHQENQNVLTAMGSIQHHRIPYGVIHFEKKGKVKNIQEKPEYDLTVNTGVYVLSKKVFDLIPENEYFDMTDLMQVLLDRGENVGVYPVSQKSYVDIGQWEEYKKAIEDLGLF